MKKLKTVWTLIALPFVIPVLANDVSQEQMLPSYVQTIDAKCDKQTDSASHLYWQAMAPHLKQAREFATAMVRLCKDRMTPPQYPVFKRKLTKPKKGSQATLRRPECRQPPPRT